MLPLSEIAMPIHYYQRCGAAATVRSIGFAEVSVGKVFRSPSHTATLDLRP